MVFNTETTLLEVIPEMEKLTSMSELEFVKNYWSKESYENFLNSRLDNIRMKKSGMNIEKSIIDTSSTLQEIIELHNLKITSVTLPNATCKRIRITSPEGSFSSEIMQIVQETITKLSFHLAYCDNTEHGMLIRYMTQKKSGQKMRIKTTKNKTLIRRPDKRVSQVLQEFF